MESVRDASPVRYAGHRLQNNTSRAYAGRFRFRKCCLSADSEERREPADGIDTETVDSLKAVDPSRPTRGADIGASINSEQSRPAGEVRKRVSDPFPSQRKPPVMWSDA